MQSGNGVPDPILLHNGFTPQLQGLLSSQRGVFGSIPKSGAKLKILLEPVYTNASFIRRDVYEKWFAGENQAGGVTSVTAPLIPIDGQIITREATTALLQAATAAAMTDHEWSHTSSAEDDEAEYVIANAALAVAGEPPVSAYLTSTSRFRPTPPASNTSSSDISKDDIAPTTADALKPSTTDNHPSAVLRNSDANTLSSPPSKSRASKSSPASRQKQEQDEESVSLAAAISVAATTTIFSATQLQPNKDKSVHRLILAVNTEFPSEEDYGHNSDDGHELLTSRTETAIPLPAVRRGKVDWAENNSDSPSPIEERNLLRLIPEPQRQARSLMESIESLLHEHMDDFKFDSSSTESEVAVLTDKEENDVSKVSWAASVASTVTVTFLGDSPNALQGRSHAETLAKSIGKSDKSKDDRNQNEGVNDIDISSSGNSQDTITASTAETKLSKIFEPLAVTMAYPEVVAIMFYIGNLRVVINVLVVSELFMNNKNAGGFDIVFGREQLQPYVSLWMAYDDKIGWTMPTLDTLLPTSHITMRECRSYLTADHAWPVKDAPPGRDDDVMHVFIATTRQRRRDIFRMHDSAIFGPTKNQDTMSQISEDFYCGYGIYFSPNSIYNQFSSAPAEFANSEEVIGLHNAMLSLLYLQTKLPTSVLIYTTCQGVCSVYDRLDRHMENNFKTKGKKNSEIQGQEYWRAIFYLSRYRLPTMGMYNIELVHVKKRVGAEVLQRHMDAAKKLADLGAQSVLTYDLTAETISHDCDEHSFVRYEDIDAFYRQKREDYDEGADHSYAPSFTVVDVADERTGTTKVVVTGEVDPVQDAYRRLTQDWDFDEKTWTESVGGFYMHTTCFDGPVGCTTGDAMAEAVLL
ncbi:uncharacterized protein V1518DRAFT_426227 [Limtongia smithiae]|uniref:uncharacterized protein n=1 Tax=Limtongia smithiae TaxID=1125753 RepID=UPI0034CDE870